MKNLKGFTLAEVMLTLGILAMVLTMALPDIAKLFADQKSKIDELQIDDITRAMTAYAKSEKMLPAAKDTDPNWIEGKDWADELAKFSKLSAEEMRTDAWGNPRVYEMYVDIGEGYRQGSIDVYYATVLSVGEKGDNESYVDGEGTPTEPKRTWSDLDETAYSNYRPAGDDLVARFSDFELKTELYELRVERLRNIIEALEVYATEKFNDADAAKQEDCETGGDCDGLPARIYYPRSGDSDLSAAIAGNVYDAPVLADMTAIIGKQLLVPGDELDMKGLVRLLNLPETYAMDPITEEAFYFYSNPKPGDVCTAGREQAPFMPIVLSVGPACSTEW